MSIHPSAVVSADARVHASAVIGPHVVIDGPVVVAADVRIGPAAILLGATEIGAGVEIHSHAVIGDTPQDRRYAGEASRCVIGAGTIIREGVTIHRATGAGETTIVGERCQLMTNSHVAHNCRLGNDVLLISGALLGGHVVVGDRAIVSGNTGVHQFVRIGALAMVACVAPVTQDVPPYMMTDHQGRIVGLNSVGLRRAGYSATEREQLKLAYRLIYRTSLSRTQVIDRLEAEPPSTVLQTMLEFLRGSTDRGIVRGRSRPGDSTSAPATEILEFTRRCA
ncbi:MAG: acyl-ACP--UDP-N-acetylglucosamine O-acyltransferase [Planctomycetaceae bacterium]|nr:acyl-ACP--UDP-N-acetylglucosamine O-acyltransferase [Planctomycetaceae bacterium]